MENQPKKWSAKDLIMITFYWGRIVKKYVLIILAIVLCIRFSANAAVNLSALFIRHLSTCEQFSHDDGRKITMILGWTNRKCYFQEITHNRTIMCGLSPIELMQFTQEIKGEYEYSKGLASIARVRPYFKSQDTCIVKTRIPDETGF